MDLKKRKHFASRKEDKLSLFLSYCLSFKTKKYLVLVNFYYNAAGRRFLKTFRKFAGKRL